MKTKQPEVTLVTWTHDPIGAIALAVSAWTCESIEIDMDYPTKEKLTNKALKAFHKTALEYVDMVFVIRNCSRAFQQQLTRTRVASFSIQSMRVVAKEGFATNGHYTMPPGLSDERQEEYNASMRYLQNDYEALLKNGFEPEDARGALPLNIHSDITMRINLNGLYHMLEQRLCVNTQWEYRQVALQMKQEIQEKIGNILSDPIDAPCVKCGKCPMREEYCGLPVWKYKESTKAEIYKQFVRWKKVDREWDITWNGEKPELESLI